jgi:hypothetical protein
MKTYHGSCHCGAVRFAANIDLAAGTLRCNCSICAKSRFWPAIVAPADFRLLTGESDLHHYQFGTGVNGHPFCRHCGVRAFGTGHSPRWGRFYSVNVCCLDGLDDAALAAIPITYLDGRNDDWHRAPAETGHL